MELSMARWMTFMLRMKLLCNVAVVWLMFLHQASTSRILAVIPFSGKSHYIGIQPILQELANRGHDVTVITSYKEDDPPPNYHQIVVAKKLVWESLGKKPDIFSLELYTFEAMIQFIWNGVFYTTEVALNSSSLHEFIRNDQSHFDLVFTEIFYQESLYMFAHKYKAPIVGLNTMGFSNYIGDIMGSPVILPYMTHEFLNFGAPLTLIERFTNVYSTAFDLFWRRFYLLPKHQALAEKHFGHLPGPLPRIEDLEKNISLVFLNTHYSYDVIRPLIPGIVEIGGVHIKNPIPLTPSIQKFLNESKDGAIYFSLGSNVQSKNMARDKVEIFLKVFGRLKERVLWKWEDETLAGKPDNVMIGKWLPQNDILAHPKVKLFITHGGLLSTQEAMYHGIPVVGLPFYGDQHLNIEKVEKTGFGLNLKYSKLSEDILEQTLRKLLDDPKYRVKAQELSLRFRDRPNSALDTAMYWIEYVIRHKGASFLRSPIADMSFVEYHMMDLIFISLTVFVAILYLAKFVVKRVLSAFIKTKKVNFITSNGKKHH